MSIEHVLIIYAYGWLVTGHAHLEKASWLDFFASCLAALFWPVTIPGLILRKLIRQEKNK